MGNASARHQSRRLSALAVGTSLSVSLGEPGIYCLRKGSILRKCAAGTCMETCLSHSFLHFQAKEERSLLSLTVPVLPPPLCTLTLTPSN